jgi:S-methylmethionine-dependent homocysteine/selenocysteine methylase
VSTGPLQRLLSTGRPLLLDGALGTELEARGVACALPLWSANALVSGIESLRLLHREYCAAGVDLLTTDTFRTTGRAFRGAGLPDRSAELTALAVRLAQEAARDVGGRTVLVGGSIGPLEDCYRPDLVPRDGELRAEHAEHAARLAEAGVDVLMLETIGTIREGVIALEEALATGLETTISFLCRGGRLYGGEGIAEAVTAVSRLGPSALLVNCLPPAEVEPLLGRISRLSDLPLGAYANVGRPGEELAGGLVRAIGAEAYATTAAGWIRAGARIIGGCCGTNPGDIRLIREKLDHAA